VACGISDTEENRLIFLPRLRQRFFAPWIPVYRIMSVLQQVRADLIDQAIGIWMLGHGYSPSEFGVLCIPMLASL
jgi:hypothetical protein